MENYKRNYLSGLNENQLEAVSHINGPLLILAGAGTGKTKVLTSRIIHILNSNIAFPSQILAVTFTNKAANEMKQRVENFLENVTSSMNIGTFHSIAAKILRRHAEVLGYTSDFTIINQDDQLRLTKQLIKDYKLDEKSVSPKGLLYYINRFKDKAIIPENLPVNEAEHFASGKLNQLYTEYQSRLKNYNAMDFGDLLLNNIQLFNNNLDICLYYQNKFKYILVDEYQDTNIAQYLWLRTLSQNNNNICCVGDDDQSIYAWRGAEVTNILKFDKDYPDAKVVRLEKNYRSTQHILNLASKLIANNTNRHSKSLWTDRADGDKVKIINYYDDKEEARAIADEIDMLERMKKTTLSEVAILVRAGYQTRNFEESLNFLGVPYRIVGSTKFYDRLEIKDCIGYIRLLVNNNDNLAFERVVNTPKRGVGNSTLVNVLNTARELNLSMFDATKKMLSENKIKGKAMVSLKHFITQIDENNSKLEAGNHTDIVKVLLNKTGYIDMWKSDDKHESKERVENINELINSLSEYENLQDFLQYISLISDADNVAEGNRVNIMTIHAAKGLEFDTVFLPGWEEGVFPGSRSIEEEKESGLEEERRLAYVAITRAKRNLSISYVCYRRIYGDFKASEVSRFINELPKDSYQIINNYFNNSSTSAQKSVTSFKEIKKENYKPVKKEKFSVGTKVAHTKFGRGIVLFVDGNIKEVFFEKDGMKKIMSEFLELI
jgi:DNA helicase-2/ATP-dependent DNA helicase PcrA